MVAVFFIFLINQSLGATAIFLLLLSVRDLNFIGFEVIEIAGIFSIGS